MNRAQKESQWRDMRPTIGREERMVGLHKEMSALPRKEQKNERAMSGPKLSLLMGAGPYGCCLYYLGLMLGPRVKRGPSTQIMSRQRL